jgi:hypothetical protein
VIGGLVGGLRARRAPAVDAASANAQSVQAPPADTPSSVGAPPADAPFTAPTRR